MRADSLALIDANAANEKEPRYLIVQSLDDADTDLLYLPSHDDVALPGGGTVLTGLIEGLSATSQKLNPDQGRAEIGSINYKIVDVDAQLTIYLSTKYGFGYSIFGKRTQVYFGYKGFEWADYVLVQTQQVSSNEYHDGIYSVGCHDIQRATRKDIFEPKKTKLTAQILASDTVDGAGSPIPFTLSAVSTAEFEMVAHGSSYSDAPNLTVGYLRIKDTFIRYNGKTAGEYTGCVVVFGTRMETFDAGEDVEEVIYLEMPAPKLAYAVLTGILHNQGGATLPAHWHLGIDPSLVRLSDFTSRIDWWDGNNDSATIPLRFWGETRTDGKRFLEEQIYLVMGAYSPVYADGALGFRSMVSIIPNAPTALELNTSNVESYGPLKHDYSSLHNQIRILWSWDPIKEKFARDNLLIGANSIGQHGPSDVLTIEARGLHGSIHAEEFLNVRFNSIADRYLNPLERIKLVIRFGLNGIEIGDVPRVSLDEVRDFVSNEPLRLYRAMEVQQVRVDWLNGGLSLDLFGSTSRGETLSLASTAVLPDAHYIENSNGEIDLKAYLDNRYGAGVVFDDVTTPGVGHFIADCELPGAALMSDALYYYDGSLHVDGGVVVTITKNVWLRRRGHLQIDGEIDGVGRGLPGSPAYTEVPSDAEERANVLNGVGVAGYFGATHAGGFLSKSDPTFNFTSGLLHSNNSRSQGSYDIPYAVPPSVVTVKTLPRYEIAYVDGVLVGMPDNLMGSAGGGGGAAMRRPAGSTFVVLQPGGDGGAGGAGFISEGRGVSFGASGRIDLSGASGAPGVLDATYQMYSSGGAGGAPGGWLDIEDGDSPVVALGRFIANQGVTPVSGNRVTANPWSFTPDHFHQVDFNDVDLPVSSFFPGFNGAIDQSKEAHVSVPIIGGETPVADPDIGILTAPTGISVATGNAALDRHDDGTIIAGVRLSWVPSVDSRTLGYEVRYKLSSDTEYRYTPLVIGREAIEAFISGLISGAVMDFGVRAAGADRIKSNWIDALSETIIGKEELPTGMTGLVVSQSGGGPVVITCDEVIHAALPDFAGNVYRFGPQDDALTWGDATPINTKPDSDNVTDASLPPGDHRIFGKRQDMGGRQSLNAVYQDITITTDYNAISDVQQFPGWPGTLTNFVINHDGKLLPSSTMLASELTEEEIYNTFIPHPEAICTYDTLVYDLGFDTTARIFADIASHLGPGATGIANPKLQVKYTTDAGAWTDWVDWVSGEALCRYVQFRLLLDTSVGVAVIDSMRCVADLKEWSQHMAGVAIGTAGTVVTFDRPYHLPPFASVQLAGSVATSVRRRNITATSMLVETLDANGALVADVVDIDLKGV